MMMMFVDRMLWNIRPTDTLCVISLLVGKPRVGASDREPVDLGLIVKILLFPLVATVLVQIGRNIRADGTPPSPAPTPT